jgi:hypothetical protein
MCRKAEQTEGNQTPERYTIRQLCRTVLDMLQHILVFDVGSTLPAASLQGQLLIPRAIIGTSNNRRSGILRGWTNASSVLMLVIPL